MANNVFIKFQCTQLCKKIAVKNFFSVYDEFEPSKICVADVSFFCRFYSRDSGLLKFKIHAGFLGRPIPPTGKRLVAFTFHPLYPFAISVQKTNAEYVVNFHIRHLTSGVEHT